MKLAGAHEPVLGLTKNGAGRSGAFGNETDASLRRTGLQGCPVDGEVDRLRHVRGVMKIFLRQLGEDGSLI